MIPKHEQANTQELLSNIPEELRRRSQWVVWKYEKRDDDYTKVPYIAGGVGRADSTDSLSERGCSRLEGNRGFGED